MSWFPKSKLKYKRVLLKYSGEALMGSASFGIDPKVLDRLASELRELIDMGVEVGVVIGGGNLFRGKVLSDAGLGRVTGDHMGMLATVMNSLALQSMLEAMGVPARVQTAIEMKNVAEPFIRRVAMRHLQKGRVVIFGAGTGNPFFSTDTTAALRASEVNADVILKATNVDGVYDSDPKKNPDAVRFESLTFHDALSRRLKVMDSTAFSLCMDNNKPIIVFDMNVPGNLKKALMGEHLGTLVSNG